MDYEQKAREIVLKYILEKPIADSSENYLIKLISQALKEQSESRSVKLPIRSFFLISKYYCDKYNSNFKELERILTKAYNEGFEDACEKFNIKIEGEEK